MSKMAEEEGSEGDKEGKVGEERGKKRGRACSVCCLELL